MLSMMQYHQPLLTSLNKIEVIQEVVLREISKLNDQAPDKKQEDQKQFSPKKTLEKKKNRFDIAYYICYHTNFWVVL